MTSLHYGLPELYVKVFEDFCREYPEYSMRIARFLIDLSKRCKSRGLDRTLCIDLPKLGKSYDKGLSTGRYVSNNFVNIYQGGYQDNRNNLGITPILELSFRMQDGKFTLRSNLDPRIVFFSRTFLYCCKKLLLNASKEIEASCIGEFFSLDRTLCRVKLDRSTISTIRSVSSYLVPLRIPEWNELNMRHGPGAVSDLNRRRVDKFNFNSWSPKLEEYFPIWEFYNHRPLLDDERIPKLGEAFGKVCCVPKTLDKVRVITIEPSSNQFIQQSLRDWLIRNQTAVALRCVNTQDQRLSQIAAKRASIDGLTATIDLKSASDFLSLDLFKLIFSPNKLLSDMLIACRTKVVCNPEGKPTILKKYAGQGNATTFIIQSLIYTILALSAIIVDEKPKRISKRYLLRLAKKVRVFGDDIVMPSSNILTFSRILRGCGLQINSEKSHTSGFFREACGGDYFHGYNVTPFYLKRFHREKGPEELVSWCAVSNNAYKSGLWLTSYSMRELDLPVNSPSGVGYLSNLPFRYSPKGRRWNRDLQRYEYKELIAKTRNKTRESELRYGRLYKYFIEKPSQHVNWNGSLTVSTSIRISNGWVA